MSWITLLDEREEVGESTLTLRDDVVVDALGGGAPEDRPLLDDELMR